MFFGCKGFLISAYVFKMSIQLKEFQFFFAGYGFLIRVHDFNMFIKLKEFQGFLDATDF